MANHITNLRIKAGFATAKDAAIKLGISTGMMYQMEESIKKPGTVLAIKMAELFSCELESIFLPYITTNSDRKLKKQEEELKQEKEEAIS